MRRNLIVLGGSAGALNPLRLIAAGLPRGIQAALLVVTHIGARSPSYLPQILTRSGAIAAAHAIGGEKLVPGTILVAPPDQHLLVQNDAVVLSRGPRENRNRPAIDPLFRSAARWGGPKTIGVLLSGLLDDGMAGAAAIRRAGGVVVVQDPADAEFGQMPEMAIAAGVASRIVPATAIADVLIALLEEDIADWDGPPYADDASAAEQMMGEGFEGVAAGRQERSSASGFACPDCHGALWEVRDGGAVLYECRIAHRFSPESLLAAQDDGVEAAIWAAHRALEERAAMLGRFAERARARKLDALVHRYEAERDEALANAATVRAAVERSR